MDVQRTQLKQAVRQAMKQTRPRPIWMTLLYLVIVAVGGSLIQRLLSGLDGSGQVIGYYLMMVLNGVPSQQAAQELLEWVLANGAQMIAAIVVGLLVINFVVYLWKSLMAVGFEGYCLSMVRGENPGVPRLFCAFPRVGSALLTRIVTGIFVFLWFLLFFAAGGVVIALLLLLTGILPGPLLMVMWLASLIAMAIGIIWISLRYAMADYLLLDQGLSGLAAVRRSKEMMRGNTKRLFVLLLSFIGWYAVMFAVALVLIVILVAVVAAQSAVLYAGGNPMYLMAMISGTVVLFAAIIFVVEAIISLWLQPYLTGSVAKFYDQLRLGPAGGQGEAGRSGGWDAAGGYDSYTWHNGPAGAGEQPGPNPADGDGTGTSDGGQQTGPGEA